jgi:hypothetical protein
VQSAENTTINVAHNSVVLSPERQQQLREQRKRILATTKGAAVLAIAARAPEVEAPLQPRIPRQSQLVREAEVVSGAERVAEPEQPEKQPESLQEPDWVSSWKMAADAPRNTEEEPEVDVEGLRPLR